MRGKLLTYKILFSIMSFENSFLVVLLILN